MAASNGGSSTLDSLIEQLANEPNIVRRRQILQANRALWGPEVVTRLYDEVVQRIHSDLLQADRLAGSAAWLARQLGDESSRAVGLRALGHILYVRRKYDLARLHYQQAAAIYQKLGKSLEVGRTLSGSLQTLIYLGLYDEAVESAAKAREIFTLQGERLHLARLETNVGNLLYRQDRFEEALEAYRRAHAELVSLGQPLDAAIALKNMATCQISLNDFRQALDTYAQARAWCEEHHMPLLAAEADYNIAYLFYLRGEYTRAIELYRATREHCSVLGDLYHQGLCDLDQSEMYLELNLVEEGAHLADRALKTFQQLRMGYEMAKAMTNLAIASSQHGHYAEGLDLFHRARDLFIREGNASWTATIDLYQALVFYEERRLNVAWILCERALGFFTTSPLAAKAALCEMLLARIHLDAERLEESRRICLGALDRLKQAETPALTWQGWYLLGMIEEALGAPGKACEAYRKAYTEMESLRSHLKAEEMKIAFLKDKLAVYEALVRLSLSGSCDGGNTARNIEAAFGYMEQAKSRSLADLIAFRASGLPSSKPAPRRQVEQANVLREELNWYSRAIQIQEARASPERSPVMERLRRAARDCERRLAMVMTTLRAEDQEYASLQGGGAVSLDDIRSVLPRHAKLLQYYRTGGSFCVALLSREDLRIIQLGDAATVRKVLQLLRFQLSKFRLSPEYVRTFQHQLVAATNAHLQEAYEKLAAPIEQFLDADHLIVAPHSFLHYLPFQALFDGNGYLGTRFSISYTPSASVYYLCCMKKLEPSNRSLVLGVPDPSAPHILTEVNAVASALPGAEVFTGTEATHDVLRQKGAGSRFVHIATHGSFRQDNPMFSSIRLGTSQLSLYDLYELEMPAELVTLSGCGTGLNVVVGGDELMGLKRGLLYAGAQAVLLTLWDVNDQSTAEFMKLFYERLAVEPDKARAVQFAMEEIRRKYEHPFYWAPFALVGKYS